MDSHETAVPISPVRRDRRDGPDGIRKHQCAHCDKSFKRREHWQRHTRSHTNEKPFECRYCHKRYARKDLVTRHEKTLHGDNRTAVGSARGRNSQTGITPSPISPVMPMSMENYYGGDLWAQPIAPVPNGLPAISGSMPAQEQALAFDYSTQTDANTLSALQGMLDPALRDVYGQLATYAGSQLPTPASMGDPKPPATNDSESSELSPLEHQQAHSSTDVARQV